MTISPAAYLAAAGFVVLSVDAAGKIHRTKAPPADAAAFFWVRWILLLPDAWNDVKPLLERARKYAGDHPDAVTATAALHRAAAKTGARLMTNDEAIAWASKGAAAVDEWMKMCRADGMLSDFNSQYKRRRKAAAERGEKFMNYKTAKMRLETALVPRLLAGISGKRPDAGLFRSVFER
jgi:predicted nucleic acid-binding protein